MPVFYILLFWKNFVNMVKLINWFMWLYNNDSNKANDPVTQ